MLFTSLFNYFAGLFETYLTSTTATIANAIAPAVYSLLSLYVIVWGVLCLRGQVGEHISEAATRFVKIGLICSIALNLGHYNELITDTFLNGPEDLARMLTGATAANSTMSSLDAIFTSGGDVARGFWAQGGLWSGDPGMYMISLLVWGVTLAVTTYSFLLLAASKFALCIIIGFGPIFIVSLLFQTTANYFSSWIHQMANFSLLSLLVIATNNIAIIPFKRAALEAAGSTDVEQIMPMLVAAALAIFVLGLLTAVAAGLAGGLSLSSQGAGRMGMSAITGTAGKAGSLLKAGFNKQLNSTPRPPQKRMPRDSTPRAISYENRDNHIGPAP